MGESEMEMMKIIYPQDKAGRSSATFAFTFVMHCEGNRNKS